MSDKKLYAFAHLHKASVYRSEDLAEGVRARLDELQRLHDRAMARIVQIRKNPSLTARGKAEEFGKLKTEMAKEFASWSKVADGYAEQIKRIEETAHPTRHPVDDAAWAVRQSEIRSYLRSLDPAEMEAAYKQAAEDGNNEILEAVEHAPIPFRLATAGLVEKISRQRWEREQPNDAAKLADLQAAKAEALSALASVHADLRQQGIDAQSVDVSHADAA